jgi:hypothetical protein
VGIGSQKEFGAGEEKIKNLAGEDKDNERMGRIWGATTETSGTGDSPDKSR